MDNPFLLPDETYKRDLNMFRHYCHQAATYLQLRTNKPYDVCLDYVKKQTGPGGKFEFHDPDVEYLVKETEGNRVVRYTTMQGYMKMVSENRHILAATLTAYVHPDIEESDLAGYAAHGLAQRSAYKKQMYKCANAGDELGAELNNNRQKRAKIKINSISGAHGTSSSVLFNQSAHSTLTTTCRSASSNTNASTERFLTGNRHYWSHHIAINNIVSIVGNSDYDAITHAINKWGLVIPTAEQVCELVKRSTDLYWSKYNDVDFIKVKALIHSLTDLQRAAFIYTGDMYSMMLYNEHVIRDLYDHIAVPATEPIDNPKEYIDRLTGDDIALISIVCNDWLNYKKIYDKETVEGPYYGLIGATAKRIIEGTRKYRDLFVAFWLTPNMPPSMAHFPSSIRRTAIASDTDSSIFTNQDWTTWYVGKLDLSPKSCAAAAATTYLCSQITAHVLATMSANLGVADKHLRTFEMKNEYAFNFFSLTTMAKHYFASMNAQEGNVYKKPKWEIKGANLKNSKAPRAILERADELIKEIAAVVMAGEQVELLPILNEIADTEVEIITAIRQGSTDYFSTAQIKSADAYKNGENSNYQHSLLWNEVFAPKYGMVQEPPYDAIKINIDADNPTKTKEWLESMKDRALAKRMEDWMNARGKRHIKTLYLPTTALQQNGVPEEILDLIDVRSMVIAIMRTYYLILETLGYYCLNKNITRLISDDRLRGYGLEK